MAKFDGKYISGAAGPRDFQENKGSEELSLATLIISQYLQSTKSILQLVLKLHCFRDNSIVYFNFIRIWSDIGLLYQASIRTIPDELHILPIKITILCHEESPVNVRDTSGVR